MSTKYYALEPAQFKLDGGAMFGIVPKPLWEKVHPSDDLNRITLSLRLLVIETSNKLIVIDTGIGDYHNETFEQNFDIQGNKNPIEQALNKIHFSTKDVTDLVISHLHFDHVGGLITLDEKKKQTCVFPNATIHLHKEHFNYSLKPTDKDKGSFHNHFYADMINELDNKNKIHWLTKKEGQILQDKNSDYSLDYKVSFGHTPYLLHPFDKKIIYLTDLVPTSNHVHVPWIMAYDVEPAVTAQYKKEILDFIIEKQLTCFYEHDPKYWGSLIEKNAKGKYSAHTPILSPNKLSFPLSF